MVLTEAWVFDNVSNQKSITEERDAWNGEIGDDILVYMSTVGVGISIVAKRTK